MTLGSDRCRSGSARGRPPMDESSEAPVAGGPIDYHAADGEGGGGPTTHRLAVPYPDRSVVYDRRANIRGCPRISGRSRSRRSARRSFRPPCRTRTRWDLSGSVRSRVSGRAGGERVAALTAAFWIEPLTSTSAGTPALQAAASGVGVPLPARSTRRPVPAIRPLLADPPPGRCADGRAGDHRPAGRDPAPRRTDGRRRPDPGPRRRR